MSNYEIGYKKPPPHSRFKKGQCANPQGRGAGQKLRAGKQLEEFLRATVEITEGGKSKRVTRQEFMVLKWVHQALNGNSKSAELLLEVHYQSKRNGDYRHVAKWIRKSDLPGIFEIKRGMDVHEAAAAYHKSLEVASDEIEH